MFGALLRALLQDALAPGLLGTAGVLLVGVALFAAQVLVRAGLVPGVTGALRVVWGLTPAVLVIALPIGVLVASVTAGRAWRLGGDLLGLACGGLRARALAPGLLAVGLVAGGVEATLTHGIEPWGRASVRRALVQAAGDLHLVPGQPVSAGPLLLRVGAVRDDVFHDVFVVTDAAAVTARSGHIEPGGVLQLQDGTARGLDQGWSASFGQARLPLPVPARRVELVERSDASLRALIERMRANGHPAPAERMALYKRTVLPATLPLLCLLGLPLGARRARPELTATAVVLGWWALMRVCDQALPVLGPALSAWLPAVALGATTLWLWLRWSER